MEQAGWNNNVNILTENVTCSVFLYASQGSFERDEQTSGAHTAFQVRDSEPPQRWGLPSSSSITYFSAPTLTSIKISQQDRTLLLIIPHTIPCSAVQTVGSDMGAGSDGIMQLSVIVPTVVMVEIFLPWKLSFVSHFPTRRTTLTDNFTQLWWKLLISADRY